MIAMSGKGVAPKKEACSEDEGVLCEGGSHKGGLEGFGGVLRGGEIFEFLRLF